jgi:uncharacterized phiE125 gp8 family phage protein
MNVEVVVQPAVEPLEPADLYQSLRLDAVGSPATHHDDALLETLISAARQEVESSAHVSLVRRTLRLSAAGFPRSAHAVEGMPFATRRAVPLALRLPRGPVASVTDVKYYDADNMLQTVASSDYYLTDEQVPQVRFLSSFAQPETYDRPDAVRVTYVAGYAPTVENPVTVAQHAGNIPQPLLRAMIVAVQRAYDPLAPADRQVLDLAFEALIAPLRLQVVA